MTDAVDLFAGPGGWSEGLRRLGLRDLGVEHGAAECATRYAAGHASWHQDVSTVNSEAIAALFGGVPGLIASPPCPKFSAAGDGEGRQHLPALCGAVDAGDWSARPSDDPLIWLALEVGRWAEAMDPEWIACEQVLEVLPLWRAYETWLRARGYSTWSGVLCAADYGVPQTRRRAILMASRVRAVSPPEPTHAKDPQPTLFGELLPWVSMADALGWNENDRLGYKRGAGAAERHGSRPSRPATARRRIRMGPQKNATVRSADEPSPTVLASLDNGGAVWLRTHQRPERASGEYQRRRADLPAPTISTNVGAWAWERPATTVCADPRIGRPGHKDREGGEAQFATDAVKVTIEEASILQDFPPDYPWQGNRSERWTQAGNAVPPGLAAAVVGALTERRMTWRI